MNYKKINFAKYSSIKIGPIINVAILDQCSDYSKEFHIIGGCNNILVGPNPPKLMMLSKKFNYIKIENNLLKIGGATPSGQIVSFCKKNNISNFEFLAHLPGKLGGLVFMNAGVKEYEIFNNLVEITTCSHKKKKCEIDFTYRKTDIKEPILEASFKIEKGFNSQRVLDLKKMRSNQPSDPSAGSCFKNPPQHFAGKLIEELKIKGIPYGSMEFSTQHANFLINKGDGQFKDAISLINKVQKEVYSQFNIKMELEIEILDKNYL